MGGLGKVDILILVGVDIKGGGGTKLNPGEGGGASVPSFVSFAGFETVLRDLIGEYSGGAGRGMVKFERNI